LIRETLLSTTSGACATFPRKIEGLAHFSRRLRDSSTSWRVSFFTRARAVHQLDSRVERRRTQVQVTLRRPEILVTGELLNGPRRRPTHREMRTERVPQDVQSGFHVRSPCDPSHHHIEDVGINHDRIRRRAASPGSGFPLAALLSAV